ncbi:hypothetical protein OAM26_01115 [Porticoccaceae bacterium]|nr:hypothetical protein [Porticoccaceae bacterium]
MVNHPSKISTATDQRGYHWCIALAAMPAARQPLKTILGNPDDLR